MPASSSNVRQVLGRLQRHRSFSPQCADHRHRVHRHRPGPRLSRRLQGTRRGARRRTDRDRPRRRRFPPFRALRDGARLRKPPSRAGLPHRPSRSHRSRATCVVPRLPEGGKLSEVMLLVVAIVGTTIAPWQLFFQQSYVIDKRVTPPRFSSATRKPIFGLVSCLSSIGAVAMMAVTAAAFAGTPEFGNFADAESGCERNRRICRPGGGHDVRDCPHRRQRHRRSAVSLSTAYAVGDVLSLKHSLHRKPSEAKGFYVVYCGLNRHRRRARPDAQRTARALDQCGADTRWRPIAKRDGVPAAACNDKAVLRSMDQHALAQSIRRAALLRIL